MNWDAIGAIGEVVGALAVVLTLLHLSAELRRARVTTEADSVDSLAEGWNTINSVVFPNREMMEIFIKGNANPEDLDEVDRGRFALFVQCYVNHFQTIMRRFDNGALPEKEWLVYAHAFANLMDCPGGRWAVNDVAVTAEVMEVLAKYRNDASQFSSLGSGSDKGS